MLRKMAEMIINGITYVINHIKPHVKISTTKGTTTITVNGETIVSTNDKTMTILWLGDLAYLDCNVAEIHGNVTGDVDANTLTVTGYVGGDVDANTVTCNSVNGNVDANTVRIVK